MRVCLASTSPARLMLMRQAGIEPLLQAPDVDEDAVIAAAEKSGRASMIDRWVLNTTLAWIAAHAENDTENCGSR